MYAFKIMSIILGIQKTLMQCDDILKKKLTLCEKEHQITFTNVLLLALLCILTKAYHIVAHTSMHDIMSKTKLGRVLKYSNHYLFHAIVSNF